MYDKHNVVTDSDLVPQTVQKLPLLRVAVAVASRIVELVRIAHANEVTGDQSSEAFAVRHDVSPQVGRRRVAMLEHNGVALTLVNVGHAFALDLGKLFFSIGFRCYRHDDLLLLLSRIFSVGSYPVAARRR